MRTLCLLVIVAAVFFALLGNRIRQAERQRYVIGEVLRLEGYVWYADERTANGYSRSGEDDEQAGSVRRRLSNSYFRTLEDITIWSDDVPDKLLAEIARLPAVHELTVTPPVLRSAAVQRLRQSRPDLEVHEHWAPRHVPFREVKSPAELRREIATGNVVLFTDGWWSMDCQETRPKLAALYNDWIENESAPKIHWLRIDLSGFDSPMPDAFRGWLDEVGLGTGGMKQSGAGWIVWFQDGKIRDAMWCHELPDEKELLQRTSSAFSP
ncbi:MAG TPA: hypothetical protein VMP01_04225 [Pirellulaceae bacterium]|nr:hypothetical protein [Pirellulaceae bacterium]